LVNRVRMILALLDSGERIKLSGILSISLLNGAVCTAGIASIVPFIGLVSRPEIAETNSFILKFSEISGIASYPGLVVLFGCIALLLLILGNVLSALDDWYGELFGSRKELQLSARLLENYLASDVLEFEQKNSGERVKEVVSDIDRVIMSTLYSLMDLVGQSISCIGIVGLLLWIDASVALIVFSGLSLFYFLINYLTSTQLERLGEEHADLESRMYSHVMEALQLQREIKLNEVSTYFVERYRTPVGMMVRNSLKRSLISDIPQYLLEIVAFGVLLCVALYYVLLSDSGSGSVAIIGMYAVAAYRLIPMIASIFDNVEDIWFDSAILESLVERLTQKSEQHDEAEAYPYGEVIEIRNGAFGYAAGHAHLFDSLNLQFPVGEMTCVKGKTGCGKSTVLALLSGLYRLENGTVVANGQEVDVYSSKAWKRQIGLVPPVINMMQASLYENIALGKSLDDIDKARVHEVCTLVELDEHIQCLENGYVSVYGEGGLSFSSGQLQKIGLARALYRKPSLLLLDECTDAFDLKTESIVLNRLKSIDGMTIVFVSHRPSVMDMADRLIDLEELLVNQVIIHGQ